MDPLETVITNNTLSAEEIQRMIDSAVKRQANVARNRTAIPGATGFGGSLLKAWYDGDHDRQKRLNDTFTWLRAAATNDQYTLGRLRASSGDANPEFKLLNPMVEGTGSAGGFTAPTEFAADLLTFIGQFGIARRYADKYDMASGVTIIPKVTGSPSVAVTAENGVIAATAATLTQETLTAKKLAGIVPFSNELLADANISTYEYILSLFGEQLGIAEDTYFFGPGSADFVGLASLTASAVMTYRGGASTSGQTKVPYIAEVMSATVNPWKDLARLIDSIPTAYSEGGQIFIDQHALSAMLGVTNANFSPVVDILNVMLTGSDATGYKFGGYPIIPISDGLLLDSYTANTAQPSKVYAIFGNLKKAHAILATRGGFEVDQLREGTLDGVSLATNDLQALRVKERIAMACAFPGRIGLLSTSAT